ncbi:hypothetical protein [Tsuneonella sp. HG222]
MTFIRIAFAGAVLLLAGCNDTAPPEEGGLKGEVLEGTISDAMVPLDQVRSRAPLAEPGGDGEGTSPAAPGRTSTQAAEVDAAQPTPEPAETPAEPETEEAE